MLRNHHALSIISDGNTSLLHLKGELAINIKINSTVLLLDMQSIVTGMFGNYHALHITLDLTLLTSFKGTLLTSFNVKRHCSLHLRGHCLLHLKKELVLNAMYIILSCFLQL